MIKEALTDEFGGEVIKKEHLYPAGSIEQLVEMLAMQ